MRPHDVVLIRNADLVATMEPRLGDGALGLIPGGDVAIEDDRIAAVGQGLDDSGARIVDATARSSYPASLTCTTTCGKRLFGVWDVSGVGEWQQTCVLPVGRLNVTAEEPTLSSA